MSRLAEEISGYPLALESLRQEGKKLADLIGKLERYCQALGRPPSTVWLGAKDWQMVHDAMVKKNRALAAWQPKFTHLVFYGVQIKRAVDHV
ncbi:MAG: hypothetical protein AAF529_08910 [Pseudomonadota bacterium]